MTVLPLLITKALTYIHHSVREITYSDMARQASDWIPEEARTGRKARDTQPITLNFAVPKKNRLAWISRKMQHQPH